MINIKNKNIIFDAIIILVISTILALIFNQCRSDGIPIIPTAKEKLAASDDELFNNLLKTDTTTINNTDNNYDTLITIINNQIDTTPTTTIINDILIKNFGEKIAEDVMYNNLTKALSL